MKRIIAILLAAMLLLSCAACTQNNSTETSAEETPADGQNTAQTPAAAGTEKADLGLTDEIKPATDYTAKANAAVYDELDFNDKQEYEFATRGLIDAPETLELKDEDGNIL